MTALLEPSCLLLVACEKVLDKPVGYMLSSVGQRDIGKPQRLLQILEQYVAPDFRGPDRGAAARQLEDATAQWATEQRLTVAVLTCVPVPKQIAKWERKGFRQTMVTLERAI